ncbi:MAG TPA: FxLYD domain-containing protein [Candidatus Wunengus sp. YC60]|uniref:FxLYD domain-containing protein n=1 Tax=Candidatus Wunengus sp. YC60 TaxID=3367697 RepID=UPI004026BB8D
MKKFLVSLIAVNGLALLIFSAAPGNTLCAQDASNKVNMLEIVISNLIARVEALEKRVSALEKNSSAGVAKAPKKEALIKEPPKSSLANGFEDIGNGFFVRNVRFNPFGTNVLFTGEIANRSEKNYRFAKFTLEIYDDRDSLVKKEEFTIPDLPKENVKSFEAMLIGVETGLINRYVIKAVE